VVALRSDLRKMPAFLRRDVLVSWSYRTAFFADWLNLVVQVGLFYFMSRLIDPQLIPQFGGSSTTYMEFVGIGIAFSSFVQASLGRVVAAIRNEQLMGTLESLLVTPTAPATLQLGSVVYDLVYVPVRTAIFLGLMVAVFGIGLEPGGLLPATAILVVFIPFSWGLGVLSAAAVLTLRRGSGVAGIGGTLLTLTSGAYFPLTVFPGWLRFVAEHNPLTVALDGARGALLGGDGWSAVWEPVSVLVPLAAVTLTVGAFAFRQAIKRERRRGTLFLY
jgi:ABC-2 type transport system permease protein